MLPMSAVWAGPERNAHLGGPPLLMAKTEGATPFRLSTHLGDVGHMMVVGPTGAGKSTLLALMALQFRRYPGARVLVFDMGGSARAAIAGMQGAWHDLGALAEGERVLSFQPLARIDDPGERAWAAEWLAALLRREALVLEPADRDHLWSALGALASAPPEQRTLTGLSVLLQSNALRQALRPFTLAGPYGRLLDADQDHLGITDVVGFELETLLETGAAAPVLAYLFHRLDQSFDGRPTLLIIDEESCPTRLFLPNDRAIEPLDPRLLRTLRPQRAPDRDHRPRESPSATTTSRAAWGTACSSSAWGRWPWPLSEPRPNPIEGAPCPPGTRVPPRSHRPAEANMPDGWIGSVDRFVNQMIRLAKLSKDVLIIWRRLPCATS